MKVYGVAEIAVARGVTRQLVAQWHKRGKLPEPDEQLASGPVWLAGTIEPWLRRTSPTRKADRAS